MGVKWKWVSVGKSLESFSFKRSSKEPPNRTGQAGEVVDAQEGLIEEAAGHEGLESKRNEASKHKQKTSGEPIKRSPATDASSLSLSSSDSSLPCSTSLNSSRGGKGELGTRGLSKVGLEVDPAEADELRQISRSRGRDLFDSEEEVDINGNQSKKRKENILELLLLKVSGMEEKLRKMDGQGESSGKSGHEGEIKKADDIFLRIKSIEDLERSLVELGL